MLRLRARLQDVRRLLRRAASERELSPQALQRLRWFAFALEHRGNVSLTCRHFGIARSTFLRWAERFDVRDSSTLEEHSRRPHTVRQPETDDRVVARIRQMRETFPLLSKEQIVQRLHEEGITVSASTVGRIITKHGFFFANTPSHKQKRQNALTAHTPDGDVSTSVGVDTSTSLSPSPLTFRPEPGAPL